MKNYFKILVLGIVVLTWSCDGVGIWNLKEVNPCTFSAGFRIEKAQGCTVPCSVEFIADDLGDNNLQFKWVFSDGEVKSGMIVQRDFDVSDDYTVTLTVSGYGCEVDSSSSFMIGEAAPVVDFTPGNTTVTAPATITFVQQTTGADNFEWLIDGVPVGTGSQLTQTFGCDDTLTVTLRATGQGGTSSASHDVIVRPHMFPLRKFLSGTAGRSEKVFGVDEAPGLGFYLMANNKKANYLVTTDTNGENPNISQPYDLEGNYSQILTNSFEKTSTGYLLVGTAVLPSGNTDFFVFKARSNFTFFDEEAFSKPLAGASEKATGITSLSGTSPGYLVSGTGAWDNNVGFYLSEIDLSLNATNDDHERFFVTDPTVSSQAIDQMPDGRYVLTASSTQSNETFVQFLDANRNTIGTRIPIGSSSFTVYDIVVWDDKTIYVFGIESNSAKIVKLENGIAATPWNFPNYLFRAGLRSSDDRLLFVGQNLSNSLPAFCEIHPQTGALLLPKNIESSLLVAGQFYSIAETQDCGFVMAGEGALTAESYHTILVKTDRKGEVK